MSMKKFDLYLYLFLTAAVWIAIVLAPMWAKSPGIAAQAVALPFLAWVILTAYYSLRWLYHKAHKGAVQQMAKA